MLLYLLYKASYVPNFDVNHKLDPKNVLLTFGVKNSGTAEANIFLTLFAEIMRFMETRV